MTARPNIPNVKDAALKIFLRDVILYIDSLFRSCVKRDRAVDSIQLVSSGGVVYTVSVNDAGTITTTKVAE